jgi:hypothetical protein
VPRQAAAPPLTAGCEALAFLLGPEMVRLVAW